MKSNFIISVGHVLTVEEQNSLRTWFGDRNIVDIDSSNINVICNLSDSDIEFVEKLIGDEHILLLQFKLEAMKKAERLKRGIGFKITELEELEVVDTIPNQGTIDESGDDVVI